MSCVALTPRDTFRAPVLDPLGWRPRCRTQQYTLHTALCTSSHSISVSQKSCEGRARQSRVRREVYKAARIRARWETKAQGRGCSSTFYSEFKPSSASETKIKSHFQQSFVPQTSLPSPETALFLLCSVHALRKADNAPGVPEGHACLHHLARWQRRSVL